MLKTLKEVKITGGAYEGELKEVGKSMTQLQLSMVRTNNVIYM